MPEKKKQELKDRAPIVAAYLRVSTDKQTILNQKSEVINFHVVERNREWNKKRK